MVVILCISAEDSLVHTVQLFSTLGGGSVGCIEDNWSGFVQAQDWSVRRRVQQPADERMDCSSLLTSLSAC